MCRVVIKFGGSLLRSGSDYLRLVKEVRKYLDSGCEVVVVVSAMKGVTDLLESLARPCDDWYDKVLYIRELHAKVIRELGLSSTLEKEVMGKLSGLLEELYRTVEAINVLKETSPRVRDYVLSFGERLSVLVAWAAFTRCGIESVHLTGREAGIVTDERYGEATPIMDMSRKLVNEILGKFLRARIVPVVTGFIAGTPDGKITTLGRGGSDYTATLLAALLGADHVVLYTDVPGIMTGDPKYVNNPRVVPNLSYDEAIICAKLGAKRLHPRTFEPVKRTNVKTVITSPGVEERTVITRERAAPPLKLVTVLERNDLVKAQVPEKRLDEILVELSINLSKHGISDLGIMSYSELDNSITIVTKEEHLNKILNVLTNLQSRGLVRDVQYIHYVSLVSIVGYGVSDLSLLSPFLRQLENIDTIFTLMFNSAFTIAVPSDKSIEALVKLHNELIRQWQ